MHNSTVCAQPDYILPQEDIQDPRIGSGGGQERQERKENSVEEEEEVQEQHEAMENEEEEKIEINQNLENTKVFVANFEELNDGMTPNLVIDSEQDELVKLRKGRRANRKQEQTKMETEENIIMIKRNSKCICSQCDKQFSSRQSRWNHVRNVHGDHKQVTCTEDGCEYRFGSATGMWSHLKNVHGNLRPVVCTENGCDASFVSSRNMERHVEAVHKKKRPFVCASDGCLARFGQQGHLQQHIRIVHEHKKPASCLEVGCKKSFRTNQELSDHLRARHDHPKLVCRVTGCSKQYTWYLNFRTHKRKSHKLVKEEVVAQGKSAMPMTKARQLLIDEDDGLEMQQEVRRLEQEEGPGAYV